MQLEIEHNDKVLDDELDEEGMPAGSLCNALFDSAQNARLAAASSRLVQNGSLTAAAQCMTCAMVCVACVPRAENTTRNIYSNKSMSMHARYVAWAPAIAV